MIQAGRVPVSIGLLAASAWIMAWTTDTSAIAVGVTAVGYVGQVNPLWVFGIAAALGGIGLI